jgi:hypothetical protein
VALVLTLLTVVSCHAINVLIAMTDINVIIYRQEEQKGLQINERKLSAEMLAFVCLLNEWPLNECKRASKADHNPMPIIFFSVCL